MIIALEHGLRRFFCDWYREFFLTVTWNRSLFDKLNDSIKFQANPGSESKSQNTWKVPLLSSSTVYNPDLLDPAAQLASSSQLNLAVFSSKQLWTGTAVPNARGLTDLIAGSSVETRIVPAAAIGTCDVINTGRFAIMNLVKNIFTFTRRNSSLFTFELIVAMTSWLKRGEGSE